MNFIFVLLILNFVIVSINGETVLEKKLDPNQPPPSKRQLEEMANSMRAKLNEPKEKPPPLTAHKIDLQDPDMWKKWGQAIGVRFAKSWQSLAVKLTPDIEGFCRGFADTIQAVPVPDTLHKLTYEEVLEYLKPVNTELIAEAKRQKALSLIPKRASAKIEAQQLLANAETDEAKKHYEEILTKIEAEEKEEEENPTPTEPLPTPLIEAADMSKYSYGMAAQWSKQFPTKWPMDTEAFCETFQAILKGEDNPLQDEEYKAVLYYIKNGVQYEKKLSQQKEIAQIFLDKKAAEANVTQTESGLLYEIVSQPSNGVGPKPNENTRVVYHAYGGRHRGMGGLDTGGVPGKIEPGEEATAKPLTDKFTDLIDGVQEGLKMMTIGDHFKFWVKPSLAWGDEFALLGKLFPHDVLAVEIFLVDFEMLSEEEQAATKQTQEEVVKPWDCDAPLDNEDKENIHDDGGEFQLLSSAFKDGEQFPARFSCHNVRMGFSPPLHWKNPPSGTKSFALRFINQQNEFVHWLMYDIYAARRMLKSRAHTPKPGVAGVTSWGEGRDFYGAVCPQDENGKIEVYTIELYALSIESVSGGSQLSWEDVKDRIEKYKLGKATLTGSLSKQQAEAELQLQVLHRFKEELEKPLL